MKVVVIGCTHAGTAAINKIASEYKNAEIVVYEKNNNISFLSCGIALYIQGVIKDTAGLFYSSPEKLKELGVNTFMEHEVTYVDFKSKELVVRDMKTNKDFTDSYDKLIITSGSWPINPNIPGSTLENVILCKNFGHAREMINKTPDAKNIVVVGGGYIGVELVEAFEQQGKNVTLIDVESRMLNKYLDKEFTDMALKEYEGKSINLALGQKVLKFTGTNKVEKVITNKQEFDADLVILAIGFRPNTDIFRDKLNMLPNGAIVVDRYMRTSAPDVLAAGDCCTVLFNPTQMDTYIPLATNAIRMGTLAAINMLEPKVMSMGTQGTSGIKIYGCNIASTGLIEEEARKYFIDVKSVTVVDRVVPEFMPVHPDVTIKMVYRETTKELLGCQICSTENYTEIINALSVCIQNKMTMEQIAFVDQFFQPHYNKPWNLINSVALQTL